LDTVEAEWNAEGVMLPNGSSIIVAKEKVRGVPGVLPLPPAPEGVDVQLGSIHMEKRRLRDGKKILMATINQNNKTKPPLVYYYWKQSPSRKFELMKPQPGIPN